MGVTVCDPPTKLSENYLSSTKRQRLVLNANSFDVATATSGQGSRTVSTIPKKKCTLLSHAYRLFRHKCRLFPRKCRLFQRTCRPFPRERRPFPRECKLFPRKCGLLPRECRPFRHLVQPFRSLQKWVFYY